MKKVDRRISRTKKRLRESLTTLMQEKPVQSITVREIAEMADINRSTFYLHYQDVYDMVTQIQDDMFQDFNDVMMEMPEKPTEEDMFLLTEEIFTVIQNNADLVFVLLGKNGDTAFVEKLKDLVKERTLNDWSKLIHSREQENFDYYYAFIIAGYIGVIEKWLKNGLKETPTQMAEITRTLIMSSPMIYERKKM